VRLPTTPSLRPSLVSTAAPLALGSTVTVATETRTITSPTLPKPPSVSHEFRIGLDADTPLWL